MNKQVISRWVFALAIVTMVVALGACDSAQKAEAPPRKSSEAAPGAAKERDPNRLWCNEHGVYEDECVICHPEIAKKKEAAQEERDPNRLWCKEHGVYEDECVICHPELKEKKQEKTSRNHTSTELPALMCKEHQLPEAECGICRPDALAELPVGKGLKVRFASDASTSKAGVSTGPPAASTSGARQEFLGQVSFNRNQLANVTPLAAGVVVDVLKDVGDTVQADEVLSTVRSPEIAAIKREFQKALAEARLANQTLAREQDLYKRKISARQDLEAAQAAVAVNQSAIDESRQHLLGLGLTPQEIEEVARGRATDSTLSVRAPFAGTIIERDAARGASVAPGDALFHVADLSTMWMEFSIPENQIAVVRVSLPIQARFEAYPGVSFDGEVQWIAPAVDAQTRMIQARAVLTNPQGLLKDGSFGRVSLAGIADKAGLTVPSSAVQDVDGRPVVFRKIEDDLFETRLVELGAASNDRVVILAGLASDDQIVTEGSYIVKSELLKARLGAGCTDH